jgi:hypothetical protein
MSGHAIETHRVNVSLSPSAGSIVGPADGALKYEEGIEKPSANLPKPLDARGHIHRHDY